jgi:acyl-CoA synthetase (AMP-forming)/AMP-acid ligase II
MARTQMNVEAATDTVSSLLWNQAEESPDTPALVFPGVHLSYSALAGRVAERARQLLGLGLWRGDAIGLLMPNSPELVEFLMAAATIGIITIPINVRFKARELEHVLSNGMMALIASDEMKPRIPPS